VVADAALIEPVSAAKFPSIREKNREFCKFEGSQPFAREQIACESDALSTFAGVKTAHVSGGWPKFPVRLNREFFWSYPGNLRGEPGH